jgi:hypothetical protein
MRDRMLTVLSNVLVISVLAGCSKSDSPYDKLCRIYEEERVQTTTLEASMRAFRKAQKDIPEISEDLAALAHVPRADWYELIRKAARDKAHQPDWRCEVIRKWSSPGNVPAGVENVR